MLEEQPVNCVHTSITRESVMISSTQILFAEKCPGMNAGSGGFRVQRGGGPGISKATLSVKVFQDWLSIHHGTGFVISQNELLDQVAVYYTLTPSHKASFLPKSGSILNF